MLGKLAIAALAATATAWPETPFYSVGRNIYDECGNEVRFAGVNWPGAAETLLPEGLQYSSIADIVSKVKSLGLNIIRLTYAIEMIDDHLANSPVSTLKNTLIKGVGEGSAPGLLAQILSKNPQFTENTTRLEVFDAVAAECAKQEIYIHLDNHQSRGYWCCPQWDGNAWFNDTYFPVYNWTRGLGFMADRAKDWPALASMSLRNELRPSITSAQTLPYNWTTWVNNMMPAAAAINGNNSLPLIFLSGMNWDTSLQLLITGKDDYTGQTWKPEDYPYEDKLVYEIHNYANGVSCDGLVSGFYSGAYGAMNNSDSAYPNKKPVVLSEFGFGQDDGSDKGVYAQCIKNYLTSLPDGPGSWMQWVLAGSYYTRTGSLDSDETWGLLNHDWSGFRNQTVIDTYVKPFIDATYAGL